MQSLMDAERDCFAVIENDFLEPVARSWTGNE
jgi:hypothetical protein